MPSLHQGERITVRKDGFYRCNACKLDFTVRTDTIFERSHVPLHKWLYAMYLLITSRKGISSMQLSKEITITQKSAWFMLQRLREACGNDITILSGVVEIYETYIGGKEPNKHAKKKLRAGRGAVGKAPVIGMRERNGRTKARQYRTPIPAACMTRSTRMSNPARTCTRTSTGVSWAGRPVLSAPHDQSRRRGIRPQRREHQQH